MGDGATKAIQARRRATALRIDRLATVRDATDSRRAARRGRIRAAVRDGRRALRARAVARQASTAAEVDAGAAMHRLVQDGLSNTDVAVLLELTPGAVRRLLRMRDRSTDISPPRPSTEPVLDVPLPDDRADRDPDGTAARFTSNAQPERTP